MPLSFSAALDYANRLYLAHRAEFDACPYTELSSQDVAKLKPPRFPRTVATPANAHPCSKGFPVPSHRWTEHRGDHPQSEA